MPARIPQLKALLQKFEGEREELGREIKSLSTKIKVKTKKSRDAQTIPQMKALLKGFEGEREELGRKIESLSTKIKVKTKKGRKPQIQRRRAERQEERDRENKTAFFKSVLLLIADNAASTVGAETQNVEPETSGIEAERQGVTQDDNKVVVKAWNKANKAKARAEKAVQKLKRLRANVNVGSDRITAAKEKVQSRKTRACKLEIAAIFAECDLQGTAHQEAVTGEAAIVDEA